MSREIESSGIILKKSKFSESDLILRILTSEGRKMSCLAKGALQSKKRFSGGILEPTHFINFRYLPAKENLHIINSAELVQGFSALRENYDRLTSALEVLSLIDGVVLEGQNQETLFGLAGNSLNELCKIEEVSQFWIHFGLKFLFQQGVLEIEDWMKPYLSCAMGDLHKLKLTQDLEKAHRIKSQLKVYAESAQV